MKSNKVQLTIVFALAILAFLEMGTSQTARDLVSSGHPVKALESIDPRYPVMFVLAGIILLVVADFAPTVALWIIGLIFLGVILRRWDYVQTAIKLASDLASKVVGGSMGQSQNQAQGAGK